MKVWPTVCNFTEKQTYSQIFSRYFQNSLLQLSILTNVTDLREIDLREQLL